jgi:hypothetical protein
MHVADTGETRMSLTRAQKRTSDKLAERHEQVVVAAREVVESYQEDGPTGSRSVKAMTNLADVLQREA